MVDYKYWINNDFFKMGRFGDKHVKNINIGLLAILVFFSLTLLFYFLLYSSTNLNSLDNLSDYIEEYKSRNDKFKNINVAFKVMPSYNTKNNVLFMEHSTDYKKSQIPGTSVLMEKLNMNSLFFFINDTVNLFPSLEYNSESIPIGNSIDFCVSANWAPKERGFNYEIMKPVKNFTQCSETRSEKFIWNEDDTKFGLDVPAWRQNVFEAYCDDDKDCEYYCKSNYNGKYLDGKRGKRCYSYDILENICMVVEYNNITDSFSYAGGCFENNMYYTMIPATVDNIYRFDSIEMEIRNKDDPIIVAGKMSNYQFDFGQSFYNLMYLINFLFFVCFIALIVIAYFIFYYRRKNAENNLINMNQSQDFASNEQPVEA